jgi:hypothetical protein
LALNHLDFVSLSDGDVSFGPTYFRCLLEKFREDPMLGLAGGFIYEELNGKFIPVSGNRTWSVGGAVQTFRRECFQNIGGLLPIKYGCVDTYSEIAARMRGWHVQSFPELGVRHHKPTGGALRYRYRQGFADYSIGYHPVFEIARLVRQIPSRPLSLGAVAQLCGFVVASMRREKRMVPPDVVSFLRNEQKARLLPFGRPTVRPHGL